MHNVITGKLVAQNISSGKRNYNLANINGKSCNVSVMISISLFIYNYSFPFFFFKHWLKYSQEAKTLG